MYIEVSIPGAPLFEVFRPVTAVQDFNVVKEKFKTKTLFSLYTEF